MFTGIVQATGAIEAIEPRGGDMRIRIGCPAFRPGDCGVGDSIAVNGVCLTAIALGKRSFSADVSGETLSLTTLGRLAAGDPVNLERSLTLASPLGGHLVTGHIDGIGDILAARPEGRSIRFRVRAPSALARYIARKGSIGIDGISLTVNAVEEAEFDVNLVPHTLEVTTAAAWRAGSQVNLEVDIVARYLERLVGDGQTAGITLHKLREYGFAQSH
jgi:riboflavin synthase